MKSFDEYTKDLREQIQERKNQCIERRKQLKQLLAECNAEWHSLVKQEKSADGIAKLAKKQQKKT